MAAAPWRAPLTTDGAQRPALLPILSWKRNSCMIRRMSPPDTRHQFEDDGGTRAWRANQATYGRVIDATPGGRRLGFMEWALAMFCLAMLPPLIVAIAFFGLVFWECARHAFGTSGAVIASCLAAVSLARVVRR